jgi:hypothetical protein
VGGEKEDGIDQINLLAAGDVAHLADALGGRQKHGFATSIVANPVNWLQDPVIIFLYFHH